MSYEILSISVPSSPPFRLCQCVADSLTVGAKLSLKGLKPLLLVEERRKGEFMCLWPGGKKREGAVGQRGMRMPAHSCPCILPFFLEVFIPPKLV